MAFNRIFSKIMILLFLVTCLFFGIAMGNRNALNIAMKKAKGGFITVEGIVRRQVNEGNRLLNIARKINPIYCNELERVIEEVRMAEKPREKVTASNKLSITAYAIADKMSAVTNEKNIELILGIQLSLNAIDQQMITAIRIYNDGFRESLEIYQISPIKLLLKNPEEEMI